MLKADSARNRLTGIALVFLLLFLVLPLAAVFAEAFRKGVGAYVAAYLNAYFTSVSPLPTARTHVVGRYLPSSPTCSFTTSHAFTRPA